ncbi:hypothetical protein ACWGLJ_43040, partial [Streptomyces sp. NPDC055898]
MLGAIGAIGGLLFTAVATYYGAEVSKDQLRQSQEDGRREEQAQASRVSVWIDGLSGPNRELHIMNRSPDPVTEVTLTIEFPETGTQQLLASLPPCTDLVFPEKVWGYDAKDTGGDQTSDMQVGVYFRDRNGEQWVRTETGLKPVGPGHAVPPLINAANPPLIDML